MEDAVLVSRASLCLGEFAEIARCLGGGLVIELLGRHLPLLLLVCSLARWNLDKSKFREGDEFCQAFAILEASLATIQEKPRKGPQ